MTRLLGKLFFLALALHLWSVSALAGEKQKETAPVQRPRSCTDLSGEPVPCPEGHQVVLPSANNGSAEVRHCVDLTGEETSCPGEGPARAAGPADTETRSSGDQSGSIGTSSSRSASGGPARTTKAASVVPTSSTKTSAAPVATSTSPCRDLLGQPVSCPLDAPPETETTTGSENLASHSSAAAASSPIYNERATKPQVSLERSLPRNIYQGQKEFWTYPARMRLEDAYWAVPFGITTGGLIASDVSIKHALPENPNTIKNFKSLSNYGALAYGGIVSAGYLIGKASHNNYMSDTAWLAGEAGLNSFITTYGLKYSVGRQRPTEGNGQGDFFSAGQSFPSEHSAAVWSVATVIAGRYPGALTKIGMFGSAALISASRVIGQQHFTSDAFVGSALGLYFGRQALKRYEKEHATDAMYGTFVKEPDLRLTNPAYMGTVYVQLDSWVYPVIDRLTALGIVKLAPLAQKPWARMECARLVQTALEAGGLDAGLQVRNSLIALQSEFAWEISRLEGNSNIGIQPESAYSRFTVVSGKPINDSFHFGQTLYNDFGRPYQQGLNAVTGFSARGEAGPLAFYFRGEYQHSPWAPPYSEPVRQAISVADQNPVQPAIPVRSISRFQVLDAYVAFNYANNQISVGQQSLWWGPAQGQSLIFSNNATPFPMIRFTRVTPFKLPLLLKYLGPVYYDSYFGYLNGHQFPPNPWSYGQKVSFKPTPNLELGFSRTTVFAGQGITPLTWGNFAHSYFSYASTDKGTTTDPGDRRGGFNFSYRIPGFRDWLTLYAEGLVDDDPSPLAAPRRAAWNPGLYIAHIPKVPKLDLRLEAAYTDVPTTRSMNGDFFYWEFIYHDSYSNDGNILGSWVGREGKGYQASSTYWLTPRNTITFSYRNAQVAQDFMPGGVTVHDGSVKANFLLFRNWTMSGLVQYEHLNVPLMKINQQSGVTTSLGITFWPETRKK